MGKEQPLSRRTKWKGSRADGGKGGTVPVPVQDQEAARAVPQVVPVQVGKALCARGVSLPGVPAGLRKGSRPRRCSGVLTSGSTRPGRRSVNRGSCGLAGAAEVRGLAQADRAWAWARGGRGPRTPGPVRTAVGLLAGIPGTGPLFTCGRSPHHPFLCSAFMGHVHVRCLRLSREDAKIQK